MDNILNLAQQCLNCKNSSCKEKGCPVKTDIPLFITYIKENKLKQAYDMLQENNIFSNICSKICPFEKQCEGSCIKGIKQEPVQISKLEEYVNNWAKENNYQYIPKIENKNGIKIAVIGSGPAGLSCSYELIKKGFEVTVFEKNEKLGGILRYGIPEFRLEKGLIDDVIIRLLNLGVKFRTKTEFGKDINIKDIKEEGYKAIFLGIGAEKTKITKFTEDKVCKTYKPNYFLRRYNEKKYIDKLGVTVIIGGGNVAIDCARVAKKMGAEKVIILYRRDRKSMPANNMEIEQSIKEEIKIEYLTRVINSSQKELVCIKTRLNGNKIEDIKGTEYKMEVDNIVFAIGQTPKKSIINKLKLHTEQELVIINEKGLTNRKDIFAGGDLVENKSSVAKAVQSGKVAAGGIYEKFSNRNF